MKLPKKLSLILRWTTIFSLLAAFTFAGLVNSSGGIKTAYAAAEKAGMTTGGATLVYVPDVDTQDAQNPVFNDSDIPHKHFRYLVRNDLICKVDQTQEEVISNLYETQLSQKVVNDTQLFAVKGDSTDKQKIMAYLKSTNQDLNCRIVEHKNWLILLFSPHLS